MGSQKVGHDWVTKCTDLTVSSRISMWLTFSHRSVLKSDVTISEMSFLDSDLAMVSTLHVHHPITPLPLLWCPWHFWKSVRYFLIWCNPCLPEDSELASSVASSPHTQSTAQRSCPLKCMLSEWIDENQGRRERMECWTQQDHKTILGACFY